MDAAFDTPRLHLRPMGEGDEALYCRLYADPGLMRHIGAPLSVEAARRGFRAACRQQSARTQRWVLRERNAGADAGLLGLFFDDGPDTGDIAEIGVMLSAGTQGRGYAAEAITAMAARIFAVPSLRLLWTRHAADNTMATRLMCKLGFVRQDPADAAPGEWRWQLTHADWRAQAAAPGMARPAGRG